MMKRNDFLIVRLLKKVEFSVFCVDKDQKSYYDKQFNVKLPYSSGQQVKRCFVEEALRVLNQTHAPLVLNYETDKDKLMQKEVIQPCDPTYTEQLLRGWMSMPSNKGGKKTNDDGETKDAKDTSGYTRRSPFSISAMTALHPLLTSLVHENNMTFDRTNTINDELIVRDKKHNKLSIDEVATFLDKCNINSISKRNFIDGKDRVNGFFKTDIIIDLRRLFRVPLLLNNSELSQETIDKMRNAGWVDFVDGSGMKWLELPKKFHVEYATAIAWALLNWRITSNQSRTNDLMPLVSVAISSRADEIPNTIRGEINEVDGKLRGRLVVDNNYPNTKIYSTNLVKSFLTEKEIMDGNLTPSYTAVEDAVEEIKTTILNYYKKSE